MSKSIKDKMVNALQDEIDALASNLEAKKTELKELKDTPESVIARLTANLAPAPTTEKQAGKKKNKKPRAPKLTGDAREKVKTNLLAIYQERGKGQEIKRADVMKAYKKAHKTELKAGHYQDLTRELLNDKKIKPNYKEKSKAAYQLA